MVEDRKGANMLFIYILAKVQASEELLLAASSSVKDTLN